jgi:hypothetical protein
LFFSGNLSAPVRRRGLTADSGKNTEIETLRLTVSVFLGKSQDPLTSAHQRFKMASI